MTAPRPRTKLSWRRKLAFVALTIVLLVLLFEGALQILCLASANFAGFLNPNKSEQMFDPTLGYRPHPDWPDHDEYGFRNAERPDHAAVVALGDSQTYGASVTRPHAWPQQLEEIAGVSTYNMAYGGWGTMQYYLLLDEALALSPDLVVVGFYSGNDLFDAYRAIYKTERAVELRSRDATVLAAVEEARRGDRELKRPWDLTHQAIAGETVTFEPSALVPSPVSPLPHIQWTDAPPPPASVSSPTAERAGGGFERKSVLEYSKLYLLTAMLARWDLRGVLRDDREPRAWKTYSERASHAPPALLLAVDGGTVRTILTPAARLNALAIADLRIAEGLRASLDAFVRMRDRIGDRGKLAVLLIPTKELVFYELARRVLPAIPAALSQLAEQETALWNQTKAFLDAAGIAWIDPLPALRASIDAGVSPYPMTHDGHPNTTGNRILAEVVAASMSEPPP